MTANPGHSADNYYVATSAPQPHHSPLAGQVRADVCIVGAGFTGLGAALALAKRGLSVVVLEGRQVGSGASGRNGGQIHTGQRRDQDYLEEQVGKVVARALWDMAEEAKRHLAALIEDHAIDCDLKWGLLHADHKPGYVPDSHVYVEKLRRDYGYEHMIALDKAELDQRLGASGYYGGSFDARGGHLHPLNFALGIARAAAAAGAAIHENTYATRYSTRGGKVIVEAGQGRVEADWLLLAGDGYLEGLDAYTEARVMPINNFILATEPFSQDAARALIRDDAAVADSRFVVNYYRLSADRRLLFGGGENYRSGFPPDLKSFVRARMLTVFPQLAGARIDYAWGGTLGITAKRQPFVRRLASKVLVAAGYSGQGVMLGPYFGKVLADAVAGTLGEFDQLAALSTPPFPGGRALRHPLLIAAMSYYALRDRL